MFRDTIPETLEGDFDRATWARLVSEFQQSPEFLKRAVDHLNGLGQVRRSNTDLAEKNAWASQIGFPLTALASCLVMALVAARWLTFGSMYL